MNEKIEEVVKRASGALRDDWTLEQEVAQELRSHLEDKCSELEGEGESPGKSTEKAIGEFGDPDEIGRGLLGANFRRMKLRGRLKVAMRILALPLLLAAVCATIDFSTLRSTELIRYLVGHRTLNSLARPPRLLLAFAEYLDGGPGWLKEDKLRRIGGWGKEGDEGRRALAARNPGDPVLLADYVLPALGNAEAKEEPEILDYAVEHDPGNAIYRYMRAYSLLSRSIDGKNFDADGKKAWVRDRAGVDRAMAEFLEGTKRPRFRNYVQERLDRTQGLFPGSGLQDRLLTKMVMFNIPLPEINRERMLARALCAYAKLLIEEGKHAEAEKVLDAWLPYSIHIAEGSNTMIAVFVDGVTLKMFSEFLPDLYAKLGKPEKGRLLREQLEPVWKPVDEWRIGKNSKDLPQNRKVREMLEKSGGFFAPAFYYYSDEPIPEEALRIDRMISYGISDNILLVRFCVNITGVIAVLALLLLGCRLAGYRGYFIWMTRRENLRILLTGILLPAALYWLWLHVDLLSGRNGSVGSNFTLFMMQACVLFFVLPLWFLFVLRRTMRQRHRLLVPLPEGRKRARIPFASWLKTMIPYWIVFLLLTGGILRVAANAELSWAVANDRIFFTGYFTEPEDRLWQKFRGDLLVGLDKVKEKLAEAEAGAPSVK